MRFGVIIFFLIVLTVVSGLLFFSSGYMKQRLAKYTGHSEICIDGVTYIQFVSGASVKYNPDGTINRCN